MKELLKNNQYSTASRTINIIRDDEINMSSLRFLLYKVLHLISPVWSNYIL